MERRSFLKRGLLGGALLALGGGGIVFWPSREVAAPLRPLVVLDARAFQVLIAVAGRILAGTQADPLAVAHDVDAKLLRASLEARTDFGKLLHLFENALPGLLFDGRFGPFTQLSAEQQDRTLEAWRDSRLVVRRTGYHAIRRSCLVAYYVDPRSWPRLHYAGPPDTGGVLYDDSKAGTSEWLEQQAREHAQNSEEL